VRLLLSPLNILLFFFSSQIMGCAPSAGEQLTHYTRCQRCNEMVDRTKRGKNPHCQVHVNKSAMGNGIGPVQCTNCSQQYYPLERYTDGCTKGKHIFDEELTRIRAANKEAAASE
jgi:uncharacterized protein with PIN domain